MTTALAFSHVDILFHRQNSKAAINRALAMLDEGGTREEIARTTQVTVGVADANLAIERGEISILMGLSGSGKSTLLRAANGLNKAVRGEVQIGNGVAYVDLSNCDDDTLREIRKTRIAMVFQNFGLLPWRTVRDNAGLGLELRGITPSMRRKMVDEKLELVGLSRWANSRISELSGGMQQRVGLARAFATDADILLMDEPFSALDPLIRRKLQDELLHIQKQLKKTIIFVSHDIDEALKIGNQITIMREGRIIQTGTPHDILFRPVNDYVGEFVRHMNPLPVLDAASVMRGLELLGKTDDGLTPIDEAGRYRFDFIADQVRHIGGRVHAIQRHMTVPDTHTCEIGSGLVQCVPIGTSLHAVALLRQRSNMPVLIHREGEVVGLCDHGDIIRGMTQIMGG